jgi:hypothetical protein
MRKSHRPQRIVADDVTRPSAAICQIPSLPFNAKYAQLTAQSVSRINAPSMRR